MKRLRIDVIDDREQLRLMLNGLRSTLFSTIHSILTFSTDSNTSYSDVNAGMNYISIDCVYQTGERCFGRSGISM